MSTASGMNDEMAPVETLEKRALRLYFPALIVALTGMAYVATIPATLYWGDGIELATAAHVLGIAHPTGYPLYTLMLHAAQTLPLGTIGFRSNLLDAALSVLTALAWYYVALRLTRRWNARNRKNRLFRSELECAVVALTCALTLAFSRSFWFHAVTTEVYALNMLFLAVGALWCVELADGFTFRRWGAVWLLFGLALANHRLSLALAPMILVCGHHGFRALRRSSPVSLALSEVEGFASLAVSPQAEKSKKSLSARMTYFPSSTRRALIKVLAAPSLLFLGLAVCAYIPMRAAKNPPMNWGNPSNCQRLLWSVRGGQFAEFMLLQRAPGQPFTAETYWPWAVERAKHLFSWSLAQTGWSEEHAPGVRVSAVLAVLLLVTAGVWFWLRNDPWVAVAVAGACGLNLSVVFVYNIPDVAGYFQPLFPWGVLTALLGLLRAWRWIEERWLATRLPFAPAVCLFLPAAMLWTNRTYMSYLKTTAPEQYGRRLLAAAEPNSLILTSGDSAIYSLWYQQNVEHFRTDVAVFGANFLASPWYREYFRDRHQFVQDFPFIDHVLQSKQEYDNLFVNGIIKPQLAAGRTIYAAYEDPVFAPFKPEAAITLLTQEDYAVPEGAESLRSMRNPLYQRAAEGGLVPYPPFAVRLTGHQPGR